MNRIDYKDKYSKYKNKYLLNKLINSSNKYVLHINFIKNYISVFKTGIKDALIKGYEFGKKHSL